MILTLPLRRVNTALQYTNVMHSNEHYNDIRLIDEHELVATNSISVSVVYKFTPSKSVIMVYWYVVIYAKCVTAG